MIRATDPIISSSRRRYRRGGRRELKSLSPTSRPPTCLAFAGESLARSGENGVKHAAPKSCKYGGLLIVQLTRNQMAYTAANPTGGSGKSDRA